MYAVIYNQTNTGVEKTIIPNITKASINTNKQTIRVEYGVRYTNITIFNGWVQVFNSNTDKLIDIFDVIPKDNTCT